MLCPLGNHMACHTLYAIVISNFPLLCSFLICRTCIEDVFSDYLSSNRELKDKYGEHFVFHEIKTQIGSFSLPLEQKINHYLVDFTRSEKGIFPCIPNIFTLEKKPISSSSSSSSSISSTDHITFLFFLYCSLRTPFYLRANFAICTLIIIIIPSGDKRCSQFFVYHIASNYPLNNK